ncbi:hypothetical protein [Streptomyces sp. yr375]|uniref:hypothetical protein n=1 Tax=Streptomyces sp. yr375 TaxID=1761906 RepID=UPI0011608B6B|nr:hypothetical protein [Streptomyces sp. yr375]
MSYYTVKQARHNASKLRKDRRVTEVSFSVHNILASAADDEERDHDRRSTCRLSTVTSHD